ncbi:MAG: hypothetical protein IKE43_06205, partial [Coriobacteriales bacterium]|nr:hypothetical protein [Coriobacteriales bacterium]
MPTGAITFEEREAPAYDKAAVKVTQQGGTGGWKKGDSLLFLVYMGEAQVMTGASMINSQKIKNTWAFVEKP